MIKTLIIYATKYGCTADCASYLKTKLQGDVTLVDLNKATEQVELDKFDTIIIGGSIYVGKASRKLREFCENNIESLTKKKIGIFLCCALTEQANEFLSTNFPAKLLSSAKTTKIFGSEARLDKMKFIDKTVVKAVTKGDFSKFKISYDIINEFAQELK
ncbi:MAG: flavodoxin domain-containing protein [Defluviitaleaceae bacterium]|nr:flavodoxin domain-containing protein [Defluviitaleaceae bacterium]